jgi:hypothetical protein
MTTNPEARQASCRATSGTAYTVDGDWLAMCDSMGIAAGTANERLLAFYNASLGASWDVAAWDEVEWDGAGGNHTNINEAAAAFAESNGVTGNGSMFSSLGSF